MSFGTLYFKNGSEMRVIETTFDAQLTADKADTDKVFNILSDKTTTFHVSCPDFAHELDLLCRPYAIYCHPDDESIFDIKEIKNNYIVQSTPAVDKGKCVIVDRRKLDDYLKDILNVKFDFVEGDQAT